MANLVIKVVDAAMKQAAATKTRLEICDDVVDGLRIRITPAGTASWLLGCRDAHGRARRFPLGTYDKEGGMTVSAARDAARALRAEIAKGADPIADARRRRLETKNAKEGVGTLTAILDLYAAQHGRTLKSWPESRRRIDCVFAPHLNRPMTTLQRRDLQLTADRWPAPHSAAAAVRYLRPVLKWAADRSYVAEDLARIKPPAKPGRRDRVLSREELAAILPVLPGWQTAYGPALLYMLYTLARREEVSAATWGSVDMEAATWTLAATKNGQPHVVPLSAQALELIRARRPQRPNPGALIFTSDAGGKLSNWDRATKTIMRATRTANWTRHDLRRTGATLLGEMGVMPDIIEAALNDVSIRSQLAATYNRSRYRPQVADALQRLAGHLDSIQAGTLAKQQPDPDRIEAAEGLGGQ